MRSILLALLLLAPLRATDPAEIRRAATDVSQSLDVQRQLPEDSARADPPPSVRRDSDGGGAPELPGDLAPAPAEVWNLLQWTLIGLAIAAVVALLVSWVMESRAGRAAPLAAPAVPRAGSSPPPPDADGLLALAEEYAAAGRYTEAMHQVLLAATAMLHPKDSLTSWELLRTTPMPPPARSALQALIVRVDRAWFGKQAAATADYQAVRANFRDFAAAAPGQA